MSSSDWWNIKWYTKSGTKDLDFGAHSGAANSSKFRIYTKSEKRKKKKTNTLSKKKKKKEREKCP